MRSAKIIFQYQAIFSVATLLQAQIRDRWIASVYISLLLFMVNSERMDKQGK